MSQLFFTVFFLLIVVKVYIPKEVCLLAKIKVAIAGKFDAEHLVNEIAGVYEALQDNPAIELIDLRDNIEVFIRDYKREGGNDFGDVLDRALDLSVYTLDNAEAVILFAPTAEFLHDSLAGWVMGYCWSQGKPVILISIENIKLSAIVARALHAHLLSLQDLKEYDFSSMPATAFKGTLV